MPDSADPPPPGKTAKGQVGRPSSGVPRAGQIRRAVAARRAGLINLQLLLAPTLNEALEAASKNYPPGKADYVLQLLTKHLTENGFYNPPGESES